MLMFVNQKLNTFHLQQLIQSINNTSYIQSQTYLTQLPQSRTSPPQTNSNDSTNIINSFNSLLENSKHMIKGFMALLEETNTTCEELAQSLQAEKKYSKQSTEQISLVQQQSQQAIKELRLVLMDKDQEINLLNEQLLKAQSEIEEIKKQGQQQRRQMQFFFTKEKDAFNNYKQKQQERLAILQQECQSSKQLSQMLQNQIYFLKYECQKLQRHFPQKQQLSPTLSQSSKHQSPQPLQTVSEQMQSVQFNVCERNCLRDILNISSQSGNLLCFTKNQQSREEENDRNLLNLCISEFNEYKMEEKKPKNKIVDPYYTFFILTIQCIKLNWNNMEEVVNINLDQQWDNVLQYSIPMNHWQRYLTEALKQKLT